MDVSCADRLLFSYETSFIQKSAQSEQSKSVRKSYTDDLLGMNNPYYRDYIQYLHIHLSPLNGNLISKLHDEIDDFDFETTHFRDLLSNIPATPICDVYTPQLTRLFPLSAASSTHRPPACVSNSILAKEAVTSALVNSVVVRACLRPQAVRFKTRSDGALP